MSSPASLTVLQFTDVNGSLQALQCDLEDIDYGGARTIEKEETFCAVAKTPGNPDNSITISGFWNKDAGRSHTVLRPLLTDTTLRLYKFSPAGTGTGSLVLSGLSYLVEYRVKQTAGGGTKISAKFEIDGNDLQGTW